jgi:hypothetical protein
LKKNIFGILFLATALSISATAAPVASPTGERLSAAANPPADLSMKADPRPGFFARLGEAFGDAFESTTEAVASVGVSATASAKAAPEQVVARERSLDFEVTPEVRKYLNYYTAGRGRGIAIRGLVRSDPLFERAEEIFREEGVPTDLVWLAQVESGWRPAAVSPVGASGIWQFMPATAERFKMRVTGTEEDERLDFEKATRGAAKYLRWLAKRYDGNWLLAIGAYNCGEGNMDKAIARAGSRNFWTISRAGTLPTETANYVPAVLAASLFGTDPASYELAGRDAVYATLGD